MKTNPSCCCLTVSKRLISHILILTQARIFKLGKYVWYGMVLWARLISFNQKEKKKRKKSWNNNISNMYMLFYKASSISVLSTCQKSLFIDSVLIVTVTSIIIFIPSTFPEYHALLITDWRNTFWITAGLLTVGFYRHHDVYNVFFNLVHVRTVWAATWRWKLSCYLGVNLKSSEREIS